jgi:hypothetical protein
MFPTISKSNGEQHAFSLYTSHVWGLLEAESSGLHSSLAGAITSTEEEEQEDAEEEEEQEEAEESGKQCKQGCLDPRLQLCEGRNDSLRLRGLLRPQKHVNPTAYV